MEVRPHSAAHSLPTLLLCVVQSSVGTARARARAPLALRRRHRQHARAHRFAQLCGNAHARTRKCGSSPNRGMSQSGESQSRDQLSETRKPPLCLEWAAAADLRQRVRVIRAAAAPQPGLPQAQSASRPPARITGGAQPRSCGACQQHHHEQVHAADKGTLSDVWRRPQ
jgi:hypothetical protein